MTDLIRPTPRPSSAGLASVRPIETIEGLKSALQQAQTVIAALERRLSAVEAATAPPPEQSLQRPGAVYDGYVLGEPRKAADGSTVLIKHRFVARGVVGLSIGAPQVAGTVQGGSETTVVNEGDTVTNNTTNNITYCLGFNA